MRDVFPGSRNLCEVLLPLTTMFWPLQDGFSEQKSVGEVISTLARQAMRPTAPVRSTRNGVPLLAVRPGATRVTSELVRQLMEESAVTRYLLDVNVLIALIHPAHVLARAEPLSRVEAPECPPTIPGAAEPRANRECSRQSCLPRRKRPRCSR